MSPKREDVTPESVYLDRRKFLRTSIYAGTALATASVYRHFRPARPTPKLKDDATTPFETITHYNNFYEFSTDKEDVAERAELWRPPPWRLRVGGLVDRPVTLDLAAFMALGQEDRVYRLRCVEGWSMVIPWRGFPLAALLERVVPKANAKYVSFTSYFDAGQMPDAREAGLGFPYREGLRLDEALHPLCFMATGLYGKPLPNQNGAAVRLVVPWKYGFKSIKSVVSIELTEARPVTTWNQTNAREYGFYSNVNPDVDHPRWSQRHERRIGESGLRETVLFNGYGEVASLYRGMDVKDNF